MFSDALTEGQGKGLMEILTVIQEILFIELILIDWKWRRSSLDICEEVMERRR